MPGTIAFSVSSVLVPRSLTARTWITSGLGLPCSHDRGRRSGEYDADVPAMLEARQKATVVIAAAN